MFFQNQNNSFTLYYCTFKNMHPASLQYCTFKNSTASPSSCPVFSEPAQISHSFCTFRKSTIIPPCCVVLSEKARFLLVVLYSQTMHSNHTFTGFIRGILRGVRYAKSLRVLFLHRRSPSWTTLVLYSRVVFIFNEPTTCFTIHSDTHNHTTVHSDTAQCTAQPSHLVVL
jgi:hypothetical protein